VIIDQPLGLPAGSIRAILVLLLTIFVIFSSFFGKEIPEAINLIWVGAVGYYLGYKQNN
jgi:hypothetical protein